MCRFSLAVHVATCQRRKPDICPFILTVSLRLSFEEKGQSWTVRSFLLIKHCVEMNRNAVLIPGLIASYCTTSSAVGFHCWMNNCRVEQHVSGVRLKWQDGRRKRAWRLDISHQGKVKKKVRPCHVTANMPLKSFAVSEYTQRCANTPSLVLSQWISRYCNTRARPGCIEDDSLSGSHFQIYFHDKHLFQIHHVLSLLSGLHVIPGKTISAAAGTDPNKVSWWWTLITFSVIMTKYQHPFYWR